MCNRHHVVRCPIRRDHRDLTKASHTWDPRAAPPVDDRAPGYGPVCRLMAKIGLIIINLKIK